MSWMAGVLRLARMRGVREGKVQTAHTEGTEHDARDGVERWQDYGFAAQPVAGEGLRLEVAGHTIVLRLDRTAERPQLAPLEVCVWHSEGHRVTLKAGGVVQVDCSRLVVNADTRVEINAPELHASTLITAPTIRAANSLQVAGTEVRGHDHGGVTTGASNTAPM